MLSQQPPSSLPRACTKAWSLDGACASWASRLAASEPSERHLRRHVPRQRPRDFSVQTAWDSCLPTSWEAPGPGTIRGRLGRDSPEKNEGSSSEKDTIVPAAQKMESSKEPGAEGIGHIPRQHSRYLRAAHLCSTRFQQTGEALRALELASDRGSCHALILMRPQASRTNAPDSPALTWQDRPVCRHSEPDSAVGGPGSTAARAGNARKPPRGAQHHAALSTLSLLSVMPELKPTQKPGKARGSRLGFGKAIWLQGEVVGTSSRDRVHATVSRAMDSREAPEQGNRASARPLASRVRCAEEHSPSAVWTSNALCQTCSLSCVMPFRTGPQA